MKKRQNRKKYTVTVGITGTAAHVGVTHLSIMLANYLASKEKCKVALVDRSQSHTLEILQQLLNDTENQMCGINCFQMYGVDYYSDADQKEIANILQLGYDYIVLDFGNVWRKQYDYEILRCHIRIIIGSCCEWQQAGFTKLMEQPPIPEDCGTWQYAAFLGIESVRRQLEKRYHIHIHKIPFEEDPFQLHRTHFEPLNNMLQEALNCL